MLECISTALTQEHFSSSFLPFTKCELFIIAWPTYILDGHEATEILPGSWSSVCSKTVLWRGGKQQEVQSNPQIKAHWDHSASSTLPVITDWYGYVCGIWNRVRWTQSKECCFSISGNTLDQFEVRFVFNHWAAGVLPATESFFLPCTNKSSKDWAPDILWNRQWLHFSLQLKTSEKSLLHPSFWHKTRFCLHFLTGMINRTPIHKIRTKQ